MTTPHPDSAAANAQQASTWAEFCDALKAAGTLIDHPAAPKDARSVAEGYRYLTRLLRIGLEMHLEFAEASQPGFFLPSHETGKIGADNPDNRYAFAKISGAHAYVIEGTRGGAPYLSFGSQKGGYETNGRMEPTGFVDGQDLVLDAQGRFQIIASVARPHDAANWLPLEAASNAIIVRQTFTDRACQAPASLNIRLLEPQALKPLSPEFLQQGLRNTAAFVRGTSQLFAQWAESYAPHCNQLPAADQALCQRVGGDPNIHYYHSAWRLGADEMLVLTVRPPACRFWNLQLNNWWMESLDYRYARVHLNSAGAHYAADGSVTIVIAHQDPGHPNWLATTGLAEGTWCLRWVGAAEHPTPQVQCLPFARLEPSSS